MNGDWIVDGRRICSRRNPEGEARLLLKGHERRIAACRAIFILGAGAGHLIRRVKALAPDARVIVLESREEVLARLREGEPWPEAIDLIPLKNIEETKNNATVTKALIASYCVIRQAYTRWLDKDLYDMMEGLLLGREPEAFTYLISQRQDLQNLLPPLIGANGLASIKTLAHNLRTDAGPAKGKILVKALRELVV